MPFRASTALPHRAAAPLIPLAFLAAALTAAPARGYDIFQRVINATGAAQYGQRIVLHGPQLVLEARSQTLPRVSVERDPQSRATAAVYRTPEGLPGVEPGDAAEIFLRTAGDAAILREWDWLDAAGRPSAPIRGLSGGILPAPCPTAGTVSFYWSFYNGTREEARVPNIGFSLSRLPAGAAGGPAIASPAPGTAAVTGGRVVGLFNGARVEPADGGETIVIPPRGGVTFLLDPAAAPDDPFFRLFTLANGFVQVGANGRAIFFGHSSAAPLCAAPGRAGEVRSSRDWAGYARRYLAARGVPGSEELVEQGDALLGPAQAFLNLLLGTPPEAAPVEVPGLLLDRRRDLTGRARAELAALALNQSAGALCPKDCVRVGSEVTSVAALAADLAALTGSPAAAARKRALSLLRRINTGRITPVPCLLAGHPAG